MSPLEQIKREFAVRRGLTEDEVEQLITSDQFTLATIVTHTGSELREMLTSLRVYEIADEYKEVEAQNTRFTDIVRVT
jgi:hypothetical protein